MKHEIYYERDELFDLNMVITFIIDIEGEAELSELQEAFNKALKINERVYRTK